MGIIVGKRGGWMKGKERYKVGRGEGMGRGREKERRKEGRKEGKG